MIGNKFIAALDEDRFCVVMRVDHRDELIAHCVSEEWSSRLAELLEATHRLREIVTDWPEGEIAQ